MPSIPKLDLSSNPAFRRSIPVRARAEIERFYGKPLSRITLEDIARDQIALRAYPNLDRLDFDLAAQHVITVKSTDLTESMRREAKQVKLSGGEFVEHSAGGDATRLGMGAKYLLTPETLARAIEINNWSNPKVRLAFDKAALAHTNPISLGNRHMLQITYDLIKECPASINPEEVLKSQVTLITLNPKTAIEVIREFVRFNFFGLRSENVLFMIDNVYPGMRIEDGELKFNQFSSINLYNHGQMIMQEAIEGQVFRVRFDSTTGDIVRHPLAASEFGDILKGMSSKISYPIEDNDYLTRSFDPNSLAIALHLGRLGHRMIVEVTEQKKDDPQPGGFVAYDTALGRNVLIESDSGGTLVDNKDNASLARIRFLNRNFNMFPSPYEVWEKVREEGLPHLHLVVKEDWLYLQPPQGDQNFLVDTAFIQKEPLKPINNLKKVIHAPSTLRAMYEQDAQRGFLDLARRFGLIK